MVSKAGLPVPFVPGTDVDRLEQSTSGSYRPECFLPLGVFDVPTAVDTAHGGVVLSFLSVQSCLYPTQL